MNAPAPPAPTTNAPAGPALRASDIMTQPALAIDQAAPLIQAIRMMMRYRVSGLPVTDPAGRVVGILTEGDLLRRAETGTEPDRPGWLARLLFPGRDAELFVHSRARRVDEIMSSDVISVGPETPLRDVVVLMQQHRIKRLPVLQDGRLLGVVSRADIVGLLGRSLELPEPPATDATIRAAIEAQLQRQSWGPSASVTVGVEHGVVALDGCVFDIRVRDAAGVAAETTAGVTHVDNRIVCIEPYTGIITFDPANSQSTG